MIKYLVTNYQKVNCLGNMHLDGINESFFAWQPVIGKSIKVKILGMFWMKYRSFTYTKQQER